MRIIISPAKRMRNDPDSLPWKNLPQFLPFAEQIASAMDALSDKELQALWRCNDTIAAQGIASLRQRNLKRGCTPAILAYDGIQYQYMGPGVFTDAQFAYIEEHLRILSGFYGMLRPFDGVVPYRLEMQAKLKVDGKKDLYAFWGETLADQLAKETDLVVDLASVEYSKAVLPHLPKSVRVITCVFGERQNGHIVEKGTMCKMARGEMVRFLAERGIEREEEIRMFDRLSYRFSPEDSDEKTYCFIKEKIK